MFFYRVKHGKAFPREREIYFGAFVLDFIADAGRLDCSLIDFFGDVHHVVIIGVRLIKLHHGKLGVVLDVHTFVTEHFTKLVNLGKTAHDKTL